MRDQELSTEQEHGDLVRCVELGYASRVRGLKSQMNPFFEQCRGPGSFTWTEEDALAMRRADAWWFGWHEADDECALRLGRLGG